jgi:hypothetical protein
MTLQSKNDITNYFLENFSAIRNDDLYFIYTAFLEAVFLRPRNHYFT